jgi:cytochrome c oxidase assembly protein subunit 15
VARWQIDLHRITQLHGTSAMLLVGLVLVCYMVVRSSAVVAARCRNVIEALGFQVAIGYTQYFTGVPPLLVGFHLLGAVLVWVSVLRFALVAGRVSAPLLKLDPAVAA